MVDSKGSEKKKAIIDGMILLNDALRKICLSSEWTYSIFWTVRPRQRNRGGKKIGGEYGLMLMWEDGFCKGGSEVDFENVEGEDPIRKAFRRMTFQLYNYSDGLMGKVASKKSHKWAFKELSQPDPYASKNFQSPFHAVHTEWIDQFDSGIQTIAIIQAGNGLLQLGSLKIIPEDLHFVLRMRRTFEFLGKQSSFYLSSQLFSSTRNAYSSGSFAPQIRPPMPLLNLNQIPLASPTYDLLALLKDQTSAQLGPPHAKDQSTHSLLLPAGTQMDHLMDDCDHDIDWRNGLYFFNDVNEPAADAELICGFEGLRSERGENSLPHLANGTNNSMVNATVNNLSMETHPNNAGNMDNGYEGSFTLPATMASSFSSPPMDHHQHQHENSGDSEAEFFFEIMEALK